MGDIHTNTIDDLPGQVENEQRGFLQLCDVKECASSLWLRLSADTVCAGFRPDAHLPLKITALFLGPFNAMEGKL